MEPDLSAVQQVPAFSTRRMIRRPVAHVVGLTRLDCKTMKVDSTLRLQLQNKLSMLWLHLQSRSLHQSVERLASAVSRNTSQSSSVMIQSDSLSRLPPSQQQAFFSIRLSCQFSSIAAPPSIDVRTNSDAIPRRQQEEGKIESVHDRTWQRAWSEVGDMELARDALLKDRVSCINPHQAQQADAQLDEINRILNYDAVAQLNAEIKNRILRRRHSNPAYSALSQSELQTCVPFSACKAKFSMLSEKYCLHSVERGMERGEQRERQGGRGMEGATLMERWGGYQIRGASNNMHDKQTEAQRTDLTWEGAWQKRWAPRRHSMPLHSVSQASAR